MVSYVGIYLIPCSKAYAVEKYKNGPKYKNGFFNPYFYKFSEAKKSFIQQMKENYEATKIQANKGHIIKRTGEWSGLKKARTGKNLIPQFQQNSF